MPQPRPQISLWARRRSSVAACQHFPFDRGCIQGAPRSPWRTLGGRQMRGARRRDAAEGEMPAIAGGALGSVPSGSVLGKSVALEGQRTRAVSRDPVRRSVPSVFLFLRLSIHRHDVSKFSRASREPDPLRSRLIDRSRRAMVFESLFLSGRCRVSRPFVGAPLRGAFSLTIQLIHSFVYPNSQCVQLHFISQCVDCACQSHPSISSWHRSPP
jgi:hypothetical protein